MTAALLGFYLKLSHCQEKSLLDTAFLELSVCPVYSQGCGVQAALWLVTHGSWTDRGHLLPPLALSVCQGSLSASPGSDGLFLASHTSSGRS